MFFKGSRYAEIGESEIIDVSNRVIRYKGIRFIPKTPAVLVHSVTEGERLDLIAHRYFRDPERFWRICDANGAIWPDDLVREIGRMIGIPLSEG